MSEIPPVLKVNIPPEEVRGTYSNVAYVTYTENEFAVDFGIMVGAMTEIDIFKRILVSPWQFKKLVHVLVQSLQNFEANIAVITPPGSLVTVPVTTSTKDKPS